MEMSLDLLGNAIVSGLLLGGFYAAVTIGVSISFGMLDIVNIAHPAFIILGSYIAYIANTAFGIDPILASVIVVAGVLPARRGDLSGLLPRVRTPRRRSVARASRSSSACCSSPRSRWCWCSASITAWWRRRISAPACISASSSCRCGCWCRAWSRWRWSAALHLFMSRTFIGRAILAVAQDQLALRLMAANPMRIKRIAFGLSIATASVAGAVLIVIQPVEPSIGRDYIGRVFAICVLGGMGSFAGTLVAAMTLGIVESLTATFYGPSWTPAVAFGFLLLTLAVRPGGMFGR